MHTIFGSAKSVIVDLGEVDKDTPVLQSGFTHFKKAPLRFWAEPLESWPADLAANVTVPSLEGSFWVCMVRFLQRPWLERVWMFQEFVMAKELRFMLGEEFYPETFLTHTILSVCEFFVQVLSHGRRFNLEDMSIAEVSNRVVTAYQEVRCKVHIRECYQSSPREVLSIAKLMHLTQWLKATNIQDKVYALLSLTTSAMRDAFPVVYNESPVETALRISVLLLKECPLYVLYRCAGLNYSNASWSLTLEHRNIDALQAMWEPGGLNTWFCASGKSTLSMILNDLDMSLTCKAVEIGRVAAMTVIWQPPDIPTISGLEKSDLFAPFRTINTWIEEQCSAFSHVYTSEDFWRALVADLVMKNLRVYRSREFPDFQKSLTAFTRYIYDYTRDAETAEQRKEKNKLAAEASLFLDCLPLCVGRRLAVLETGVPCLVPGDTQTGDALFIFSGAPLPMVLRPQGHFFRIVGCCYIHGMMEGQPFENEGNCLNFIDIVMR
jgi:hypothetical protein